MPELAGAVAERFEARVRGLEEETLSPFAVRSYETRGRAEAEEQCRLRTPFQRDRDRIVHSKAFRRLKHKTQVFVAPRRRPFPDAPHAYARGERHLARRRARARPQRGPHRGDRARPRPRAPAVRPHRRGGARRDPSGALRTAVPPQRALAPRRRGAREGRPGAEPHLGGPRRHPQPHRARASRRRSRARSSGSSTGSPTSTTTSTTPFAPAFWRPPTCRRRSSRFARRSPAPAASTRSSTTSSSLPPAGTTSCRARRSAARC